MCTDQDQGEDLGNAAVVGVRYVLVHMARVPPRLLARVIGTWSEGCGNIVKNYLEC